MIKASEIKLLGPNGKPYDLVDIEKRIDLSMLENHGNHSYETATIDMELPREIRDKIASNYLNFGEWKFVYHRTSSENGERPGLTSFIFFDDTQDPEIIYPNLIENNWTGVYDPKNL